MSSSSVSSIDQRGKAASNYESDDEQGRNRRVLSSPHLGEPMARIYEVMDRMVASLAVVVTQQQSMDSRLMSLDSRQSAMHEQVNGSVKGLAKRLNSIEDLRSPILVSENPNTDLR